MPMPERYYVRAGDGVNSTRISRPPLITEYEMSRAFMAPLCRGVRRVHCFRRPVRARAGQYCHAAPFIIRRHYLPR